MPRASKKQQELAKLFRPGCEVFWNVFRGVYGGSLDSEKAVATLSLECAKHVGPLNEDEVKRQVDAKTADIQTELRKTKQRLEISETNLRNAESRLGPHLSGSPKSKALDRMREKLEDEKRANRLMTRDKAQLLKRIEKLQALLAGLREEVRELTSKEVNKRRNASRADAGPKVVAMQHPDLRA